MVKKSKFLPQLIKIEKTVAVTSHCFNLPFTRKIPKKKRKKIKPVGFIVGEDKIYLTTSNGRLLVIDILSGLTTSILKVDNKKISRPFVLNQNLFIIEQSSIIKLN